MARYINKNDLIDNIKYCIKNIPSTLDFKGGMLHVLQLIDNQPNADVNPVVYCKDCKYYSSAKVNEKGYLICSASGMEITDDDYCSYGERNCGIDIRGEV